MPTDLPPGSAGWFWAAAATIIATLSGVVSFLYKRESAAKDRDIAEGLVREKMLTQALEDAKAEFRIELAKQQTAIEECYKDREELKVRVAKFEVRLELLERQNASEIRRVGILNERLHKLEEQ
jgi:hypothetical protein